MGMAAASAVLERVLRTDRSGQPGDSDVVLLGRFVKQRDEAAFAELVRRHSALVWGVCRRVLGHDQDAEDAAQATFMVLSRRAHEFRQHSRLSTWLYSVAYHSARNVRKMKQRRLHHEAAASLLGESALARQQLWTDLEPVLDEELMRLPEKYQEPLVLCCLEGKTQAEAARLLGWPTGTVAARISRGREQLRERLNKRGIVVSSTLLTSMLASEASAAVIPVHLLEPAWASRCLVNSATLDPIVEATLASQRWQTLSSVGLYFGIGAVCLSLVAGGSWWLLRDNSSAVATTVPVAVQQNQRYVPLPRDPQAVVLQLIKRHMVTQAPTLTISLLGDGTIKLKRDDLERSLKLSQQEVQQLMQLAVNDMQLLSFDGDKLWNGFHQEFVFDGNLRAPEDTTETVIDLQTAEQSKNITWKQLGATEAWFYGTPTVRHLAELSRRLTSYVLVEEAGGREAVAVVCDKLNQRLRSTYPKKQPFQPHHLVHYKAATEVTPASYTFSVGSKFIDTHFYAATCHVDGRGQLMLGTIIPGPSEKPPRFPTRDKSKDKVADK
jgi:RNA polymerase sigma factor (sigma-70 family)